MSPVGGPPPLTRMLHQIFCKEARDFVVMHQVPAALSVCKGPIKDVERRVVQAMLRVAEVGQEMLQLQPHPISIVIRAHLQQFASNQQARTPSSIQKMYQGLPFANESI